MRAIWARRRCRTPHRTGQRPSLVGRLAPGDLVLVHAGMAIGVIDSGTTEPVDPGAGEPAW
jgi:hypothetical protein